MYYVYILTNKKLRPLYIGATNNLERRIFEHKTGEFEGFSNNYNLKILLHFEEYEYVRDAIKKEIQLKNWYKEWKLDLIQKTNCSFVDIAEDWFTDLDPETSSG